MALKATIFKAHLQLADVDRGVYGDHLLTLARHPSETDERMMVRTLVFALHVPASPDDGALAFAKGLWDPDEPELWRKDLTGRVRHWIEVGQPDERRLLKASGRAERVTVVAYGSGAAIWSGAIAPRIARARNIDAWRIDASAARDIGALAQRQMRLQINVQDGIAWVSDAERSVEVAVERIG